MRSRYNYHHSQPVNMEKSAKIMVITVLTVTVITSIVCSLLYCNATNHDTMENQQQQQQHQQQQEPPSQPSLEEVNKKAENRVSKPHYPQLKLAISLLHQLQRDKPKENIFYSPHSVYSTLLLAYFGAAGETEQELKHLLGLDWAKNKADVQNAYKTKKERSNRFQNQSIEFTSVDKLFVSNTIAMR